MLFLIPIPAISAGIPTIDVAAIAQTVTEGIARAKEFEQTITSARDRLNQLKAQARHYEDMVEGHYNFKDILNDPNLNQFMAMDDWKQIYNDVEDLDELREEFELYSDDPIVQRRYDNQLRQYSTNKKYYEATVRRNKNMQNLLDQFSTASTPAEKEDIANTISYEQTQIQNDAQMMATMNTLMEKQYLLEHEQKATEDINLMLGDGYPQELKRLTN